MCLSFTEHVRTFGRDCDPVAQPRPLPRRAILVRRRTGEAGDLSAEGHHGFELPPKVRSPGESAADLKRVS